MNYGEMNTQLVLSNIYSFFVSYDITEFRYLYTISAILLSFTFTETLPRHLIFNEPLDMKMFSGLFLNWIWLIYMTYVSRTAFIMFGTYYVRAEVPRISNEKLLNNKHERGRVHLERHGQQRDLVHERLSYQT